MKKYTQLLMCMLMTLAVYIPANAQPCTLSCPGDITINLDPGACNAIVSYNVEGLGDCSNTIFGFQDAFAPANWTFTNAPGNGNVDVSGAPGSITINGSSNFIGADATYCITFVDGGDFSFDWSYTTFDSPFWDPASYSLNGVVTPLTDQFGPQNQSGSVSITVNAGDQFCFIQGSLDGAFDAGHLTITNLVAAGPPSVPVLIAGLPSGAAFPIGTTTQIYELLGQTCTFDITVIEFPNPVSSLTCNNHVQVSLDNTCSATIGADMILEGGPYSCYDNYTVSIDGGGNTLDASHIGQTLQVTITGPNGNSCWGTISVEDKIAPVLECRDVVIGCTDALPSEPAPELVGPQTFLIENLNDAIDTDPNAPQTLVYDFDLSSIPAGTPVLDVDVILDMEHSWLPDLNITLTSPSGTTISFFQIGGCGGQVLPLDAQFDDEGLGTPGAGILCTDFLTFNGANIMGFVLPGVQSNTIFSGFDGEDANGTWTVTIDDTFNDDGPIGEGHVFAVGVVVTVNLPAIAPSDACGDIDLTYVDNVTTNGCNGDYYQTIERTWTAVDGSGNSTSCTQTINVERDELADVVFPADVTLNCTQDPNDFDLTGEPEGTGCFNIDVTYLDQIISICEGSYKVLRTWTAADWCTNTVESDLQIIKVLDSTGPSITGLGDLTVSTNSNACAANVQLPAANLSDDCSGSNITVWIETPLGNIQGNGGLLLDAPLGDHTITYYATDGCGNESSESFTLTVKDQTAPIAICDEHTIISIGSDGTAVVEASVFDDGSYDNCSDITLEVRKMTDICHSPQHTSFGPDVHFCCEEIGSVIMVELRVTDADDNQNSCMVEVEVQDKLDPIIVCPSNKTIECDDDYTDLSLTGEATATDNCPGVQVTHVDNVSLQCGGEGTVTRIWTAIDAQGRTSSCVQFITLINSDPFYINANNPNDPSDDVVWPLDYTTQTCGAGLDPDDLPAPFNYPVINDDACDFVASTYEDTYLPIQEPACIKILREWIIVDWCQADDNSDPTEPGPGVWHYTQIIKVINSSAPTFTTCGGDSQIENFDDNCGSTFVNLFAEATDDCTDAADLTYSWVTSNGNSGSGQDASGNYSNGSYSITWTVEDGCGNVATCTHDFTVFDAKKPTPVCLNGLATVIMPSSGEVTIWATDFESGSSYDNCTPYQDLQFSFSSDVNDVSRAFSCSDIPAGGNATVVEIWVTDNNGNQDFCLTYILLQDPNGACGPLAAATITGAVETENQEEVEDVTITLDGSNAVPFVTGANGSYAFPNMAPGGSYTVNPEKTMNPLNGVTTFDLVLISKHILGTQFLDSPYKMIAADVNMSKSITTFDIVKLRRLILHIDENFTDNESWRFVDADFVFPNANNPFATDFPEVKDIAALAANMQANFVGVKIGDVNGSAAPNNLVGTETRTFDGNLVFNLENQKVVAGEEFTVDFKAQDFNNMLGYQFTLGFDNVEFVDVATKLENLDIANFGLTMIEEGVITTSWNVANPAKVANDVTLFSLTFKANADAQLSEVLSLNTRYTAAEAYNSDEDLFNIALNFNGTTVTSDKFELFQNTPNPFKAETAIGFNLPEASSVTLKIYDLSGRVLKLVEGDFAKGYNEVKVNRSDLSGAGILYYQLETGNDTATKKMILVD